MNFRKLAPKIKLPENIQLPTPAIFTLANGIDVHYLESGEHEVIVFKMCFKVGRWYENKAQISHFTHALFKEGTALFNSHQIAEKLEFYGANLKISAGFDYCSLTVSTLSRFLEPVLEVLLQILQSASFPEKELDIYRNNVLQELAINQTKHEYVATQIFGENLWGKTHPYGYPVLESDILALTNNDLKAYFKQCYCPQNTVVYASGKTNFDLQKLLDKYIGTWQNPNGVQVQEPTHLSQPVLEYFSQQDTQAHQVSLRIGMPCIGQTHKDYPAFYVLNTILGGYFGSRLMANIREEKGYTYGIHSAIINMTHGSYFTISTEVGQAVWKSCLHEIYSEIERLKVEEVPNLELTMVKNYLAGYLLSMIDGGFNCISVWKDLHFHGLDARYFSNFAKEIQKITPKAIQIAAQKYLNTEAMVKVAVGNIEA